MINPSAALRFAGVRVVAVPDMVDIVEDWSRVRSPARARRRRWLGHPQRVVARKAPMRCVLQIGGVLHMHPAMLDKLMLAAEANSR